MLKIEDLNLESNYCPNMVAIQSVQLQELSPLVLKIMQWAKFILTDCEVDLRNTIEKLHQLCLYDQSKVFSSGENTKLASFIVMPNDQFKELVQFTDQTKTEEEFKESVEESEWDVLSKLSYEGFDCEILLP